MCRDIGVHRDAYCLDNIGKIWVEYPYIIVIKVAEDDLSVYCQGVFIRVCAKLLEAAVGCLVNKVDNVSRVIVDSCGIDSFFSRK